jgi:ATP-dependent Lhr-like helicase
MINVQFLKGKKIGLIEESFAGRLRPGSIFSFAGRKLKYVKLQANTLYVRLSDGKQQAVVGYDGGRMVLSSTLSGYIRAQISAAASGDYNNEDLRAVKPMLELQSQLSALPKKNQLLIERYKNREGWHLFFYPMASRSLHNAIGALIAYRVAQEQRITFSLAMNDYGFELLSRSKAAADINETTIRALLATESLENDLIDSVNMAELTKRQFREITRISGLVFQGHPGEARSSRHLQNSANLLYEVFKQYEPNNLLLKQAQDQVVSRVLITGSLRDKLQELSHEQIIIKDITRPTPFSLPIMVDRLRQFLSTEELEQRIKRMKLIS